VIQVAKKGFYLARMGRKKKIAELLVNCFDNLN